MKNDEKKTDIKKLAVYLAVTFIITYAFEAFICLRALEYFQIGAACAMLLPTAGVLIANKGLSGIGFKFDLKKNIGTILFAWFVPAILVALGAALYFLFFPSVLVSPVEGMEALLKQQGVDPAMITAQGLTMETFLIIQFVQGIFLAPLINILPSLGEEIGWRGFMTPLFEKLTSRKPALIISGIIWGLWHAPLIVLAGYEYGKEYVGAPYLGVLLFCVITTVLGIVLSFTYDKSKSVILPALMHGSFNAAATFPLIFAQTDKYDLLLGPAPVGIISIIPMALLAAVLFFVGSKKEADSSTESDNAVAETDDNVF